MSSNRDCRICLQDVGHTLPDGRLLFDNIDETLVAPGVVALIGRNGSGKTTLARIAAGLLAPTRGRVTHHGNVVLVGQHAGTAGTCRSLADVADLHTPLAALRRLQAGHGTASDLAAVADRWDLEQHWQRLLRQAGLDETTHTADRLSAGQHMWLALAGAWCSDADFLVLDEPGNHLDAQRRGELRVAIAEWRDRGRGLLLISHDRDLLAGVDHTLELAHGGLQRHGGGWSLVQQQRERKLAAAVQQLEHARTTRTREHDTVQLQAERAARKQARGARERATGSQGKMLLDARRERAQNTRGVLQARHRQRLAAAHHSVAAAWQAAAELLQAPRFPQLAPPVPPARASLVFEGLVAPWGPCRPLDWVATGPVRVWLRGPNGCGKSTLLRLIAGRLQPALGRCRTPLGVSLLDQSLDLLDPRRSLLAQLRDAARAVDDASLRQHLARAGLVADHIDRPVASLSGGEKLRAGLLCAALREPTPGLLLLDEPTNHLDTRAVEALAQMLADWPGALVVASHDAAFAAALAPTHLLDREPAGWVLRAC